MYKSRKAGNRNGRLEDKCAGGAQVDVDRRQKFACTYSKSHSLRGINGPQGAGCDGQSISVNPWRDDRVIIRVTR